MASDFAISRFKHLKKLILVHGHWCYTRLANMIIYFFYKNVVSLESTLESALLCELTYCLVFTSNNLHFIGLPGLREPAVLVSVLLWLLWHCHDRLLADDFLQPLLHLCTTHHVWDNGQRRFCRDATGGS